MHATRRQNSLKRAVPRRKGAVCLTNYFSHRQNSRQFAQFQIRGEEWNFSRFELYISSATEIYRET